MDRRSYLLGVFDGEGSVFVATNYRTFSPIACLTMAAERVVRMFFEEWGGGFYPRKSPTVGGLYLFDWKIGHRRGRPFLEFVAEQSLVKAEQAKLALRLADLIASKGNRLPLTEQERIDRLQLAAEVSALNGSRSRFAQYTS